MEAVHGRGCHARHAALRACAGEAVGVAGEGHAHQGVPGLGCAAVVAAADGVQGAVPNPRDRLFVEARLQQREREQVQPHRETIRGEARGDAENGQG